MKARGIFTIKGGEIIAILIKENRECYFNFGTNDWFSFEEFQNLHKHPNPKIKKHSESPKFRKDLKVTEKVIREGKDYVDICNKFQRDFKKDRGIRIKIIEMELDENATSFTL